MGQLAHRRMSAFRTRLALLRHARHLARMFLPRHTPSQSRPGTHPGSAANGPPDTRVVVRNDRGYMVALDLPR
jgi:hypothetical protein